MTESVGQSLATLYTVLWIVLIPLALILGAVLVRLFLILNDVGDFLSHVRYELHPLLKDVRHITHRADRVTQRAEDYMDNLETGASRTGQFIGKNLGKAAKLSVLASGGMGSLIAWGLKRLIRK